MMNIKINNIKHQIKPISKLSVLEFMAVVSNMRHIDLISYISALSKVDIDKANVKIDNIEIAEAMLLDTDIDFTKIKRPFLFPFGGENLIVNELDDGVFGKRYMFNIYRKQYEQESIAIYELCVYALAICVSKEDDFSDVDKLFIKLTTMNWTVILPIGFFLSKKLSGKRSFLTKYLMTLIIKLHYIAKQFHQKSNLKRIHTI